MVEEQKELSTYGREVEGGESNDLSIVALKICSWRHSLCDLNTFQHHCTGD